MKDPLKMRFHHQAHGLSIASALPLPLPPALPDAGPPEVSIQVGDVPDALDAPEVTTPAIQARADAFLLSLPGVGRFYVAGGRRIRVQPEAGVTEGVLGLHLAHTALVALLHQRGLFPLHGSGVLVDGTCVAFLAPSGLGKSTLAAALWRRGYPVLDDDILAVDASHGLARVHPGGRRLRLWRDVIRSLGLDETSARRLHPDIHGYTFVDETPLDHRACPLARLYLLEEARIEPEGFVRLRGSETFMALSPYIHCRPLGTAVAGKVRQFHTQAAIARTVPVFRWRLRWGWEGLEAALDRLEEHLGRRV